MIFPLLHPNQCAIRKKINCCEVYERCPGAKRCQIDPEKLSKSTLLDLMDFIDEAAADSDRVARGEIHDLTEVARDMITTAASAIGTGISVEWPPYQGRPGIKRAK